MILKLIWISWFIPIGSGGSISIVSAAKDDWAPSPDTPTKIEEQMAGVSIKLKGHREDDTLDLRQPSQADWIRQYMEQQEEVLSLNVSVNLHSLYLMVYLLGQFQ